ncbi:MAG TPA: xylose isomerase, partial [Clostridiaceae bacterium]|nr:xylose isomerase [Clostridiaceae bacterium]
VGADGIQIYAVSGPMDPDNLSRSDRRELLDYIKSKGLVVSALCGDLGGHGFAVSKDNPWKIEKSKKIMDLAKDLETNVVTTHIGVVPEDRNNPRFSVMQEACEELGNYGDKVGAYFAIETGPEKAVTLKGFLDSLDSKGVRVNFDPANFVMVTGDDPVQGVYTLKDYIVHTHAKDGIMIKKTNPEIVYNVFAEGGIEDFRIEDYFVEKPLGTGSVDFKGYIKALNDISYNGFLTIEREVGENPEADIRLAVNFLKDILKK